MARLTNQQLKALLEADEDVLGEVADILSNEDLSDEEKLGEIEELIFEEEEEAEDTTRGRAANSL